MREAALILDKTFELINEIKGSSIYKEYHEALDELNTFPNLKDLADDYRKAKFEAYHAQNIINIKLLDELEEKREMLEKYPQIDRFLQAELALGRVLQEVQSRITEAMALE